MAESVVGSGPRAEGPKLWEWLFTPFRYVAGGIALALGLAAVVLTGFVGSVSATHLDGVLDLHTGRPAPRWVFPVEGLLDWLSLALVLLVLGKVASRAAFRPVDLLGTQALARAPMLLGVTAALLPGYQRTSVLLPQLLSGTRPVLSAADLASFAVAVLVALLGLVWMVALMYQSYQICTNARGARVIVSFIVGVLVAEVVSKVALHAVFARL